MSFHRSQDPSPSERARALLGLTLDEIAAKLGCSEAAVSRYLSGSRTPPDALYRILGGQALAREHEEWLRATGRKRPRGAVTIEVVAKLPAGISIEQAKDTAARAIAELVGGAR